MRVWLDDIRPMPEGFDVHAYTASEAIDWLKTGKVTYISLDHDLTPAHYVDHELPGTGYDVAVFIEGAVTEGTIPMPQWAIHSQNPVGRDRIRAALESAQRRCRLLRAPY